MVPSESGLTKSPWAEHRKRLVDWVRLQLIGPAREGLLQGSPLERYPTGVLHPVEPGFSGLDPASPEDDEDHETPLGDDQANDLKMAQPVRRRRYVPPSSVGFSFFVRSGDGVKLRITASAAVYERTGERDELGTVSEARIPAQVPRMRPGMDRGRIQAVRRPAPRSAPASPWAGPHSDRGLREPQEAGPNR